MLQFKNTWPDMDSGQLCQEKLYDALFSASSEKKTGQLHVIGKEGNFSRSGTIVVKDGDIVRIRCMKHSGYEAMIDLTTMAVTEAIFMAAHTIGDEKIPGTPDMARVLQQFQQAQTHQELDNDLKQDAQRLLESLYGSNAAKKVETIASNTPPGSNPVAFLDKCKALVEPMFGNRKAEQMFAALYDKVRLK